MSCVSQTKTSSAIAGRGWYRALLRGWPSREIWRRRRAQDTFLSSLSHGVSFPISWDNLPYLMGLSAIRHTARRYKCVMNTVLRYVSRGDHPRRRGRCHRLPAIAEPRLCPCDASDLSPLYIAKGPWTSSGCNYSYPNSVQL